MRSRRGRWALCGVLAVGIALALALAYVLPGGSAGVIPSSPGSPTPVSADYYGVNGQLAFSPSSHNWARSAAQIAQLGVGTVRRDAFWSAVEPFRPRGGVHAYRWRATDELVATLARAGLRWYPIVDYATNWAGVDGWESPPKAADVGSYAAFAGALAGRYGPGGTFWRAHPRLPAVPVANYEIWNEPNFHHFWPDQSYAPARLAAMYLDAQRRIQAADPSAQVVLGGLSSPGVEGFLGRMARARPSLRDRLQAVGFHPYGGGPNGGLQLTFARIRKLRAALERFFGPRQVPIEITETGWAVPPTPEAWRGRRLRGLAVDLPQSSCAVSRFIVFAWTTAPSGSSISGAGFGIAHRNGSLTGAARAFRAGVATMLGQRSTGTFNGELRCASGE